jgi:hypothetical protein
MAVVPLSIAVHHQCRVRDKAMANEADFRECVAALGEVRQAFLLAQQGLVVPTRYEADLASFKLMEVVLQHVNAASGIAMLPKPGSHLVSAWVLLRSAFEVALTAYWLAVDDDWKEREARWLGWIAGEEEFQRKLAGDLRPVAGDGVQGIEDYALRLEQRRLAIMRLLPKDARAKRPAIPQILQECGIHQRYYVAYRIGSQLTHGGPAACEEVWETDGSVFRTKEVNYASWVGPFQMAGWCIAQPGYAVLCRSGAAFEAAENLVDVHDQLLAAVSRLEA